MIAQPRKNPVIKVLAHTACPRLEPGDELTQATCLGNSFKPCGWRRQGRTMCCILAFHTRTHMHTPTHTHSVPSHTCVRMWHARIPRGTHAHTQMHLPLHPCTSMHTRVHTHAPSDRGSRSTWQLCSVAGGRAEAYALLLRAGSGFLLLGQKFL